MAVEVNGTAPRVSRAALRSDALFPRKAATVFSLGTFWSQCTTGTAFHGDAPGRAPRAGPNPSLLSPELAGVAVTSEE